MWYQKIIFPLLLCFLKQKLFYTLNELGRRAEIYKHMFIYHVNFLFRFGLRNLRDGINQHIHCFLFFILPSKFSEEGSPRVYSLFNSIFTAYSCKL